MNCEITLIYPFRNRDTERIKKSLDSLEKQSNKNFNIVFIDYGSDEDISNNVKKLLSEYHFVNYIYTYTNNQPWNKSRAINIALKNIDTSYCFVADVDVFYRENFIDLLYSRMSLEKVIYFKVGYLSEEETIKEISFDDYETIKISNDEATGLTLFPVQKLKDCNGFDEFYHFWGSEDTDAHVRMLNSGLTIEFYDKELLLLHQYHPSFYSKLRKELTSDLVPENIVRINYCNLLFNKINKLTTVNTATWGSIISKTDIFNLENSIDFTFDCTNKMHEVDYYLIEKLNTIKGKTVKLTFKEVAKKQDLKSRIKKLLKIENLLYYNLNQINTLVTKELIFKYRNHLYSYTINKELDTLSLIIKL